MITYGINLVDFIVGFKINVIIRIKINVPFYLLYGIYMAGFENWASRLIAPLLSQKLLLELKDQIKVMNCTSIF